MLRPVALSADLPKVASLDDLPAAVSARTRMLIVNGGDPDDPARYPSRSEVLWAVLCDLARAEVPDDMIASVILDPDYGISAHVLEQKPSPRKYAERQIQRAKDEAKSPELAEMNARHAIVKYGGRVRVLVERSDGLPEFLKKAELFDWYANRMVTVGTDKAGAMMRRSRWQNGGSGIRTGATSSASSSCPGLRQTTTPTTSGAAPPSPPKPGECGLFLTLVRDVIAAGDGAVSEYLLNWMALKFQKPGAKLETSFALRGGQGIGKSLFAELYGELFGRHFVAVSDQQGLMGNFNAHLQQALFCLCR